MSKTPQPNVLAFQDVAQQNLVRRIYERLTNLETVTGSQSFGDGREAPAPPQAALDVTTNPNVKGMAFVRITNPEFLGTNQNRIAAPMRHWLQASPNQSFNTGVVDFPITHGTYLPVAELGSGTFYFRLRSTGDGKTFNDPVSSGKVVIP